MSSPFYINFWNMSFCSSLVCSSSRVPLPPSGLPPHLHLLPPADARQTGRAQQPAGRSAMWVVAEPVDADVKVEVVLLQYLSVIWFLIEAICFASASFQIQRCRRMQFYYSCVGRLLSKHHYTPEVQDVLCSGRCAVPAVLLSYVLGLPEDWLSRLPGSIPW